MPPGRRPWQDVKGQYCIRRMGLTISQEVSMRGKIVVRKSPDVLDFFLVENGEKYFLFQQGYTAGVWKYFENGRWEEEIRRFHGWGYNPRLDKTMERLPSSVRYVRRYMISGVVA